MSADLGALIPELQPFAQGLVDLAGRAGVQPRVTSTLRSHSQQQRLYDAFLRGETHYPVAPPGQSAHEFGFAFDMVAATREDLHDLGAVWQQWGGLWSASDEVHFEYPGFSPPPHERLDSAQTTTCTLWQYFWTPECKCKLIDARFGSMAAALAEIGFGRNEVLDILSSPCEEILALLRKYGYPF